VLAVIEAASAGLIPFARLVADDRACLQAVNGRLLVRPVETLCGLIEVRGLGIRRLPFEPVAMVGMVVDLGAADAERLPPWRPAIIAGVAVPRLAVAPGVDPMPYVLATFTTTGAERVPSPSVQADIRRAVAAPEVNLWLSNP